MNHPLKTYEQLAEELNELKFQLEEANDTIHAIRTGQVDAFIVQGEKGSQLYTLKTADHTYRIFIENMQEGAVTLNEEGIILYSNSRFAEKLGYPLEYVIGVPFTKFLREDTRSAFHETIRTSSRVKSRYELLIENKNGEQIPFQLSITGLELEEGNFLNIILTDLSAVKESERLLKLKNEELESAKNMAIKLNDELEDTVSERTKDLVESREHFKLLADSMPQMVWTNLPSGDVNFYNNRWYDYTGLSPQESMNSAWQASIHPDDLALTLKNYTHSLETGGPFHVENRYRRFDGVYRWHLNRSRPVRNEAGEIKFWIGTATDIEDQKKAMDLKDEFIGIASHELKTPLTSLKGYLQLMGAYKKEDLPAIIRQFIVKANESGNKLNNLVDDLLDVSKINAGRLDFQFATIQVSELIHSVTENAEMMYPGYTFTHELAEDFAVNGNVERLEQVLMNLISNSVKYSRENKEIRLTANRQGNIGRIAVKDFGIGLTDSQKELIFERFYRVEDKNYQASGLGIGLYISSEIIKAHNGRIGVDSEFAKGSTFYFELPLAG